ncbi:hypothetical protein ACQP25_16950 [Microtetraspora malaysiensis]|uniref:recombination directionality factor n=1 Tax=Microtetraspora malaysiensis TaxID=161358 RepID=UPI003D924BE8
MAIHPAVLQRRHWGDGRIRLGFKKTNQKGNQFPAKLSTFRFTSPSQEMIAGAAELYGGEVQPWDSPEGKQWQVITNATRIPVVLPPNPLTQNMEAWDAASCIRRCDGATREVLSGRPCICQAEGNVICKPTTRLSVLLKDVPSLGTWRLDSHGWNAAAELPDAAEFLARVGQYVDGVLFLREKKGTHKGQVTRYMVPGLTVEGITPAQLLSGEVPQRYALGGGGQSTARAITAGESAKVPDYLAQAREATTPEQVGGIWRAARDAGHLTDDLRNELNTIGQALKEKAARQQPDDEPDFDSATARPAPAAAPPPPAPAAVAPAEGDPEAERLRQQIITAWPGTITDLHQEFQVATGTTMKKATLEQLTSFAKVGPVLGQMGDQPPASGPAAADDEVVDADVVGEEPAATKSQLRDLGIWFGEAGVTSHTGKGSGEKNDEARFAWIREHLRITVTSTEQLSGPKVKEAIGLLITQAATRREDLRQRIVNVWADLDGTNEQLTAVFQEAMNTGVQQAKNAEYASFLKKLNDGKVTPDSATAGGE